MAFSACGNWLATANHGGHTVTVLRRRAGLFAPHRIRLSRRPVTIIKDPLLRHPHSVAFTPATNHLVVTNAGANYFTVYAPERPRLGTRWSLAACQVSCSLPNSVPRKSHSMRKVATRVFASDEADCM